MSDITVITDRERALAHQNAQLRTALGEAIGYLSGMVAEARLMATLVNDAGPGRGERAAKLAEVVERCEDALSGESADPVAVASTIFAAAQAGLLPTRVSEAVIKAGAAS